MSMPFVLLERSLQAGSMSNVLSEKDPLVNSNQTHWSGFLFESDHCDSNRNFKWGRVVLKEEKMETTNEIMFLDRDK